MNLVDEQNRVLVRFQLGHDRFQPFLEITAIAGARQQCAHVERINRGVGQNLGGFARYDLACQTFGDGGFADAGVTHQQRVVLAPAAQNLNAPFHFAVAADQRVNVALARFGVQIDAIFLKRRILFLAFGHALWLFLVLGRARDRARIAKRGVLGDAVGDKVDRVIAGHVLFLQEISRIAFAFGKDGDQHVGTGHFGAAR